MLLEPMQGCFLSWGSCTTNRYLGVPIWALPLESQVVESCLFDFLFVGGFFDWRGPLQGAASKFDRFGAGPRSRQLDIGMS